MRQILYVSSSRPAGAKIDVAPIFRQSRHNNALEGVTGLLYTDGSRFLQVLEGPEEGVTSTFERIKADPRHHAVLVLLERDITAREFGSWAMADRHADATADEFDQRMAALLSTASASIRGTFLGLVSARKAA